jgi:hypothetical protein
MIVMLIVQKTMAQGKEYRKRKINLLKSNFKELLEVCSCHNLLKSSGFVGEVDRNNDNKYFLLTQESPKLKCCIFHRVRNILCFAKKLNLELANYFCLLKLLSFDF